MKTYAALKSQIAKLEQQAQAARSKEVAGVVSRIREAMTEYGLSAADIGMGKTGARSDKAGKASKSTAGVAKYRDPKSGKTWTGHGRAPGWLANARNRDAFLIAAPAAESGAATSAGATLASPGQAPVKAARKSTTGRKTQARKSLASAMENSAKKLKERLSGKASARRAANGSASTTQAGSREPAPTA